MKTAISTLILLAAVVSSCGDDISRNDDWDRTQVQNCLDEGATPIYNEQEDTFNDKVIISFIACDRNEK